MAERRDGLGIPLLGSRGADYLLRTCALAAGAVDDYAPLLRRSAEARPGTQGPILYRAGEVEKAAAVLPNDPGPWVFRPPVWPGGQEPPAGRGARPLLFLALCRHAHHKDKEARDCVVEAVRRLQSAGEGGAGVPDGRVARVGGAAGVGDFAYRGRGALKPAAGKSDRNE